MKRIVPILLLALSYATYAKAQLAIEKSFEVLFGVQGVSCDSFADGENIDFLNYIDAEGFSGNYSYLGFAGSVNLGKRFSGNFLVGMYSDLSPVNYNISASYFPFNSFGIGTSFFGYPQYINEYNQFHWNNDIGMYADLDNNYRQRRMYNLGLAVGPEVRYKTQGFSLNLRLHGGIRWNRIFEDAILQKKINGNLVRIIIYETTSSPNPYLFPELEIGIKLFKVSETNVGFRTRIAAEFSDRTLNYSRTIAEWTIENQTTNFLESPAHIYRKIECDFGFYFQW